MTTHSCFMYIIYLHGTHTLTCMQIHTCILHACAWVHTHNNNNEHIHTITNTHIHNNKHTYTITNKYTHTHNMHNTHTLCREWSSSTAMEAEILPTPSVSTSTWYQVRLVLFSLMQNHAKQRKGQDNRLGYRWKCTLSCTSFGVHVLETLGTRLSVDCTWNAGINYQGRKLSQIGRK